MFSTCDFNPRTPRGVRLAAPTAEQAEDEISIHAPREGCDFEILHVGLIGMISIHAPREGCDRSSQRLGLRLNISIHAPREGCDAWWGYRRTFPQGFQSTHPARGATHELEKGREPR